MFGIGFSEMIFIGVLALLVIGPKQLPEVAKTIAKFLNELRRASTSLKEEFRKESGLDDALSSILNPEEPQTLLKRPTLPLKAELPKLPKLPMLPKLPKLPHIEIEKDLPLEQDPPPSIAAATTPVVASTKENTHNV